MKNLIITTLAFICITSCRSQIGSIDFDSTKHKGNGNLITQTRNINNFSELKVSGSYRVYINDSPNNGKLTLEADENLLDKIETYVEGNTLIIQTKKNTSVSFSKAPVIKVSAQNITNIAHAGSGKIELQGTQNVNHFNLAKSGSGNISAKINAKNSNIAKSGSGNIVLTGKTTELSIAKSGSGRIETNELQANKVNIKCSGSGKISVWATDELDIIKSGSGNIVYKGSPSVNSKISGSGKVYNQ